MPALKSGKVATKSATAAKRSRSMRQVEEYATYSGERPLKNRGIEAFAPAAAGRRAAAAAGPSKPAEAVNVEAVTAAPVLSDAASQWLKARRSSLATNSAAAVATVSKSTLRAALCLASVQPSSEVTAPHRLASLVRRAVVTGLSETAPVMSDVLALSAAELAASGAVILAVLPSDRSVDTEAARLRSVYGIADVVSVTGAVSAALPAVNAAKAGAVAIVLLSLDVARGSSSGSDLGRLKSLAASITHVVIFSSIDDTPAAAAAAAVASESVASVASSSSSSTALRRVLDTLASLRSASARPAVPVLVVGATLKAVSAPFGASTYAALETVSVQAEGTKKDVRASSSAATAKPLSLSVSCMIAEGALRFQTLYGLIHMQTQNAAAASSSTTSVTLITVHFATAETCLFWYDVLLALQELPEAACSIVCDTEGSAAERRNVMSDDEAKSSAISRVLAAARRATAPKVIVLLSSYATYVPANELPTQVTRRIFVQYDAPLHVAQFPQWIASCMTTTGGAAIHPTTIAMVLLRKNEVERGILDVLNNASKNVDIGGAAIHFSTSPAPSATTALLSFQRMKGLQKKLFVVAQRAFEAFRASMHVYSRLRPAEIFNVKQLNLDVYASEFGLEEAPLLDLRTKATPFRPKEDLVKFAVHRLKSELREKRAYANEHLIGEGPEEHDVPDATEGAS